jgi:hypothetical protein
MASGLYHTNFPFFFREPLGLKIFIIKYLCTNKMMDAKKLSAFEYQMESPDLQAPVRDQSTQCTRLQLTQAQIDDFWRDGYIVVKGFLSDEELSTMGNTIRSDITRCD